MNQLFCVAIAFLMPCVALAQQTKHVERMLHRGALVEVEIIGGRAMFQGDIDLGPANAETSSSDFSRWPSGIMPVKIDPDVPAQQRVLDAVDAWNKSAPVKLIPYTSEKDYVHVVRFQSNGRCSSSIGHVGGEQLLRVDDTCNANGLTHELGHALGLYHEQARPDRDYYLSVNLPNIDKRYLGDHSIQVATGTATGGYDFGSIMHYTRYEESKATQVQVYETIPASMPLDGSAHGLSAGDIDAVSRIYGVVPATTTITSNPAGLQVMVDGELYATPKAFNWAAGSRHQLDVPASQGDNVTRYRFGRWNDHGAQSHTIAASPDLTVISASFIRQYRVNTGVLPAGAGSVTITPASPDGFYDEASTVTVTETPASGFTFSGWNGTNANFYIAITGWTAPSSTFRVTIPNLNYIAHYTQTPLVSITTNPPGIPITVNGNRGASPRVVTATAGAPVSLVADPVVVIGGGSGQWVFTGWSDNGAATHTLTLPQAGPYPAYVANYKLQHLVTTAFSGTGTVTVSPASTDGYYDDGAQIQFTATAGTGFQFTGYSRDLSGLASTQSLTVNDQVYVLASFQRPFTLTAAGIVNAASYAGGGVSPGEIITIFGWQIGPADLTTLQLDANGLVATTLAGTRVLFDNVPAPLVYVSRNQLSAIVPYAVSTRSTNAVQVSLNGQTTPAVSVPILAAVPGLFSANSSGQGQASILNQNGTVNSTTNPAKRGEVVVLFGTGEGQTTPGGVDGKVATAQPLPAPRLQPVTALLGGPKGPGISAPVLYAGAAPSLVAGVLQVNISIPQEAPTGNVPVAISLGTTGSIVMTTVAIQ